ncbi:glycosyltransferase family 9 protein [Salinimicrobium sp. GXAS 041]|uniref:glycosyltransferase family 9 protein n=1 Tax=Salinimicrobium sp. GXAS 041 TaxID=3400806 RepID=UPI003C765CF1
MKVLIIQQKMIGDVLTSSILFEALKEKYPAFELHYLINTHTLPVVEHNPFIDRIILFDPSIHGKPAGMLPLLKKIKKQKYDIVIDVYAKISTAMITAFSGAKQRISYYKKYTSGAYTHKYELASKVKTHAGLAIENRMLLLQAISPDFPLALKPKIYLTRSEKTEAERQLKNAGISRNQPLFMINVLGSSPEKTYPLKYMTQILNRIVEEMPNAQLLFNYMPSQEREAKKLYILCPEEVQKHIFYDVYEKNLRNFISISSLCDAVIGNEGGGNNIAKALNIPTFSIFSPWIKKEAWSTYEVGTVSTSVHLADHRPEILQNLSKKEIVKKSTEFYELLEPDLILASLSKFLKEITAAGKTGTK